MTTKLPNSPPPKRVFSKGGKDNCGGAMPILKANKQSINARLSIEKNTDTTAIAYTPTLEDYRQWYLFQKEARERLIEKLKKIENLSRYAWVQVRNKPEEAEELFKMIFTESK